MPEGQCPATTEMRVHKGHQPDHAAKSYKKQWGLQATIFQRPLLAQWLGLCCLWGSQRPAELVTGQVLRDYVHLAMDYVSATGLDVEKTSASPKTCRKVRSVHSILHFPAERVTATPLKPCCILEMKSYKRALLSEETPLRPRPTECQRIRWKFQISMTLPRLPGTTIVASRTSAVFGGFSMSEERITYQKKQA